MAPKKTSAPKKSTSKDFDKVLNQLEKEKQEYQPPPTQKLYFATSSLWISLAPIYIYFSPVFESQPRDNVVWYLIGGLVSAFILFSQYNQLATKKRNDAILKIDEVTGTAEEKKAYVKDSVHESVYYTLWSTNAVYVATFVFLLGVGFANYELSSSAKYILSSIFASLVVGVVVTFNAI